MKKKLLVLICLGVNLIVHAQQKPNIIIIYADDLGYGDLSCYGMSKIKTPNIDKLAKQGIRFTNAHSTSATCTPSRFGLLTGKSPWKQNGTGIAPGDASLIIPTDKPTLPSMLQNAGYTTAVIGKWHLGLGTNGIDWNSEIKPGPKEVGFNYSFIMPATLDRVPCVYVENGRVLNLDPTDPIAVNYKKKIGNDPTGKENPELLRMKPDVRQGHNQTIIDSISRIGWMSGGHSAYWKDENIASEITNKAITFISNNTTKPFFLYFASGDIHVPRYPNSMFRGKSGMGLRGDAILQLDWTVGKLINALDSLHLAQNTMIIFSSDNGPVVNDGYFDQSVELLGDHKPAGPLRGGKYSIFDAGTRVPFIVKWPEKVKANKTTDVLISQIDLFASLAKLTGQPLGDIAAPDSFDMLAQLLGKSKENRSYLLEQGGPLSIIKGKWKYIEPSKGPRYSDVVNIEYGNDSFAQLYDLSNDIGETKNLALQYPDIVKELATLLKTNREVERTRF
ncbi:sulfatase family protein [Solitalea koreensis]|uniref:Arylsulfatase A n=1 Tax=Solitalea koreensis TaxID=543615 RepID=A0A521BIL1_9SPHI|nr:arylsulfatase [Solitalea koreensis]SMO46879.1 Arylsulfatase A [Solitalea koreensis]